MTDDRIVRMLRVSESDPVQQEAADDIVTELREAARLEDEYPSTAELHIKAADEIERLRAELAAANARAEYAEQRLRVQEKWIGRAEAAEASYATLRLLYEAAEAREQEAAKAQQEHVFRAFQEGFNSSLSYMGAYDMADAWEMSDAKARIDTFLKGDGDE